MRTFTNDPLLSQFYLWKREFSFGQQVFLGVRSERIFTGAYKVFIILSSCKTEQVRLYSSGATSTSSSIPDFHSAAGHPYSLSYVQEDQTSG